MKISSALGGLAGACALTVLNEGAKKIDKDAPRLDLLGMNAVAKIVKGTGIRPASNGQLKPVSLTGDLISNSLYFAMALAKPLGLDERAVAASPKTKALTIAWYVVGGIIAAAVINLLDNKESLPDAR
jgi:hypothetical protein